MYGRIFVQALLFATLPLAASAEEAAPTKHVIQPPRSAVASAPAETSRPAPARATRDTIRRLIFDFAADDWQTREAAFEAVIEHDQAAVPELEAVLERSTNPEVVLRARKALVAIRESAVRGKFTQIDARVRDALGNLRDGDTKDGWLALGDGKVTWYQRFGGTITAQTYSYDISKRLNLSDTDALEIPLTYLSLETQIGYSPESVDPKLQFHKTSDGEVRATFMGTDGMGQRTTAEFVIVAKKN